MAKNGSKIKYLEWAPQTISSGEVREILFLQKKTEVCSSYFLSIDKNLFCNIDEPHFMTLTTVHVTQTR